MLRKTVKTLLSLFTVMILLINISIPALASEPAISAATPAVTTEQHPDSEPATPGTTNGDGSGEEPVTPEPEAPAAAPASPTALGVNPISNITITETITTGIPTTGITTAAA